MNLISKIKSRFPLTVMQSACLNGFMILALTFAAVEISNKNWFHPLWVLACYFLVYLSVRVVIDDFVSEKNASLVYHWVIGSLRIVTGVFIVVIATVNGDNFGVLWLGIFTAFLYYGSLNLVKVVKIREERADRKAQEERLDYRGSEFQYARAQYHRDVLERARLAAEAQHRENALLADLAEFFSETGQ